MVFRALAPTLRSSLAVCLASIVAACVAACTWSAGCSKATSDDIVLWKTTEKGPSKLAATLRDRSTESKLRGEAALALVDIGKPDEVETALAAMPTAERWEINKTLLPLYITQISSTADSAPEKSLAYRDALFSARGLAQADDQKRIDAALMPGIEQELRTGRVRNGRHAVEKILTTIGTPAGAMLAHLLDEPITGYAAVAQLLSRVGDEPAREKGAESLVARARHGGTVPEPMWRSIGLLGGPAAVAFLKAKILAGTREEASSAVRALQERRDPSVLPFALQLAGDPKADRSIRDEMFGVVEGIGGLEAKDGLIRIIRSDKEDLVRYRGFESLLAVARQDGIVPGLEAFPASGTYKKVDVEDLLVKLIEKLGPPARPALIKGLLSKAPLARMTATLSLETVGAAADAAALGELAKDAGTVRGFPAGDTVGKEAVRVAAVVRK